VALPKALNEAWLIFQVLMVRIHFPPAESQRTIFPATDTHHARPIPSIVATSCA
jgi:hypothetical protein